MRDQFTPDPLESRWVGPACERRGELPKRDPPLRVFLQSNDHGDSRCEQLISMSPAAAMAGSALLSVPASADRVCDRNCVGPLCSEQCVHQDRDLTVGRGSRDTDVTIEERRRIREPGVEIRRGPGR